MTAKTTADLIEHDGQYQFNPANSDHEVLFNGRRDPHIKMMKLDGLFGLPELRKQNTERQARDGGHAGSSFYGMRILIGDIAVLSNSRHDTHQMLMDLSEAWQADDEDGVLVFQKPRVGKRLIYARPTRLAIPSVSDVMAGLARGTLEWECLDPRIYAFYEHSVEITITPGNLTAQADVFMGGNWRRGSPCRIEVNGPGSNVVIQNNHDENRQIKLDGAIASDKRLMIDTGRLTIYDADTGENELSRLARDNQWWELRKGTNTIQVTRTTNVGTMIVKVYWRDAFTL